MRQLPLDLPHRPALGGGDFLVAPCNAEAVAWLDRWPDWPAPALALHGPGGCGKTHLGHVWQVRSGAIFIDAPELAVDRLPMLVSASGAVILDGAERAEERALLHLYNLVAERGGHVLLIANEPPARWATALADLRSRLLAAPAVAVAAPDEALLGALLVKLFADRQLAVGADVIAYLLPRLERSFEAARQAVARLDAAALAAHRRITVPLVRQVLAGDAAADQPGSR